jgi:hypothetical protein
MVSLRGGAPPSTVTGARRFKAQLIERVFDARGAAESDGNVLSAFCLLNLKREVDLASVGAGNHRFSAIMSG